MRHKHILHDLLTTVSLLLLAALCLTGCTGPADNTTATDSSTDPSTDPATDPSTDPVTDLDTTPVYPSADATVGGIALSEYRIVYSATCEPEEGTERAEELNAAIETACGFRLPVVTDEEPAATHEILIGYTNRIEEERAKPAGPFDYWMTEANGQLWLGGGGCFGLVYDISVLAEHQYTIEAGFSESGSVFGKYLFPRTEDTSLRIMSSNVWYNETNTEAWNAIGESCSYRTRARGFAAIYMAYQPDVIGFQEMSSHMKDEIISLMQENKLRYAAVDFSESVLNDFAPILYNTKTLKLLDSGHHNYSYGNNNNSKSFTWAYFSRYSTGEKFVVITTHLWWDSEKNTPGSNAWREAQAAELVDLKDELTTQYGCPVILVGDLNTRTTSDAFAVLTSGGYEDAFDLATVYADDAKGRHNCDADGFDRETDLGSYKKDAIDHILVANGGDSVEVAVFNHIRPYFSAKLSDHYPVYIDLSIR